MKRKHIIILALVIGGITFLYFGGFMSLSFFDKLSTFQKSSAENFESEFLKTGLQLKDLGKAPEFVDLGEWVNSKPLTLKELKGKVVLIDFWTFSCINCIRTLPTLREWHEKYKDKGLVIIGIHTPEFKFEGELSNLKDAMEEHDIQWAVAQDNNYSTWDAYNNRFWPAEYLIDANGHLRYTHFGEGNYDITERTIQALLIDAGYDLENAGINADAKTPDYNQIGTPEIYLGYSRIKNFGNDIESITRNEPQDFQIPEDVEYNKFYLGGEWKIEAENSEFTGGDNEPGKIVIKYKAARLHMVLSGPEGDSNFEIVLKLDGKVLDETNKGDHVILRDGQSIVEIENSKMYNLVNTGDSYGTHTLEIFIIDPGLKVFTFTFG